MLKVKQPPTYVCCGKKSYLKFAFLVFKPVDKIQLNTTFSAFFFPFPWYWFHSYFYCKTGAVFCRYCMGNQVCNQKNADVFSDKSNIFFSISAILNCSWANLASWEEPAWGKDTRVTLYVAGDCIWLRQWMSKMSPHASMSS